MRKRHVALFGVVIVLVAAIAGAYAGMRVMPESTADEHDGRAGAAMPANGGFANPSMRSAIEAYLASQQRFSWKTRQNSRTACVAENLMPEKELFPLFIWAYCGEYILENGEISQVSGSSGPAKIYYPNELSFYDTGRFSYEVPGDGSAYSLDIQRIFPAEIGERIFAYDASAIAQRAENAARALLVGRAQ